MTGGSPTTSVTRLVGLLGHPVAHSVSPQIHTAAFAAAGVDAAYLAFDVAPDRLDAAVAAVAALGMLGANVTVPHKRRVFLAVPARTAAAEACGAVNTLFWDGDTLTGDNTDVAGLRHVLERDAGVEPGDGVVVLGAGGAARAAAAALGALRARVEVVARRAEAAEEVTAVLRAAGGLAGRVPEPRLLINATPLGLHGERLPERFMGLRPEQTALDLVYAPSDTPFVAAARARGATALDGRGMLVAQAAASFRRWTGLSPPLDAMVAAASAALAAGASR